MALEALVLAFLVLVVVLSVALPDDTEVVEIVVVADAVAHDAVEIAEVAGVDIVGIADDIQVVEAVDNSTGVVDVAAETDAAALVVQNLPACKTHPGSVTVAVVD